MSHGRRHLLDQQLGLAAQGPMVVGVQQQAHLAAAGRQLQGLADQGQGDFRLARQLAANQPLGDFRRQVNAGRFPLGKPGLFGLMDIENRLSQGGDDRGKLPRNHLLDFGQGRLPAFGLGLGAEGRGLLLGLDHDPGRVPADLLQVLRRLAGHVVEVERHAGGRHVLVGGAENRGHS